jgi:glycosyltransferase involved in cell wall biosynthesis
MRVLLFDPLVGGHHIEYATYLARCLLEAGDQVGFMAWRPHPLLESLEQVGVTLYYAAPEAKRPVGPRFVTRLRQSAQALACALQVARRDQFDVVHNLYVDRGELPMAWALRRRRECRAKVFATLFWPYFVYTQGIGRRWAAKRLYHTANRRVLASMLSRGTLNGLFVHTEDIRNLLLGAVGNPALADSIHVVPDPAAMPPPDLSQGQARRLLGLPLDRPLVLFFGGLRWEKGWDILLRSTPLLKGDLSVVLAGQADSQVAAEVERAVPTVPCQRLEARLSRVDEEDVDRYFVAADLVVVPYRRVYMGTSGVLQRAAAAGRPVVAAAVGQIGAIVQRHGLGVVCLPEDPQALAEAIDYALAQQEPWRKEVRARSLEYAQSQDWRMFGAQVRAGYMQYRQPQGTEQKV